MSLLFCFLLFCYSVYIAPLIHYHYMSFKLWHSKACFNMKAEPVMAIYEMQYGYRLKRVQYINISLFCIQHFIFSWYIRSHVNKISLTWHNCFMFHISVRYIFLSLFLCTFSCTFMCTFSYVFLCTFLRTCLSELYITY